jgi:carboxyl-terminal processing protease
MIERFFGRILLLAVTCGLTLASSTAQSKPEAETVAETSRPIKAFQPVTPGVLDGRITYVAARILEQVQMSRQPFDDTISSRLLDDYLKALDPQRLHFTQSDLSQFEQYRTRLDNLTLTSQFIADTTPACEIFNRYMERLQQRVAYAQELLQKENFKFDGDERILVNRKEAAYPKDLAEARKLWRERLRYEYLQERLGKLDPKKKTSADAKKPAKTIDEEIVETLKNRYDRTLRTFVAWDTQDMLQVYLSTMARVYDPHSDYMGKEQLESFAIGMNLSLFGIGAELLSEDGYCTIRRIIPEGPAEKSKKLKVNDRIVAVAQSNQPPVDVVDMNLSKAVQLIRGPKGTEVRLTIVPAEDRSTRRVISLVRDEIKLEEQQAKAKIIEMPDAKGSQMRVGIIDLPSFYAPFDPGQTRGEAENRRTSDDVAALLKKFKEENVAGVVLDLRRNGGGSLEEAIRLTGLFIKQGPVVQIKDTDSIQVDSDDDPSVAYGGPLVVLTSRFSASASEILAGALQDYGRAIIVGDVSTHGKGTVQSVQPLRPYMMRSGIFTNEPGALKLTIKKFYRASGASTQLKGVNPDIVLPSVFNESKEIGESALENPMPWDTIPSAEYERVNMVGAFLPELKARSDARIATDKDFAYILEDIEQFKKLQADKSISLNEKQRVKERQEAEARQKTRDKERLTRPDPDEKVYELTVKLSGLPGLPAAVQKTNLLASAGSRMPSASVLAAALSGDETAALDPEADGEESDEEPKAPSVDATLMEARNILVDYVSLLRRSSIATIGQSADGAVK